MTIGVLEVADAASLLVIDVVIADSKVELVRLVAAAADDDEMMIMKESVIEVMSIDIVDVEDAPISMRLSELSVDEAIVGRSDVELDSYSTDDVRVVRAAEVVTDATLLLVAFVVITGLMRLVAAIEDEDEIMIMGESVVEVMSTEVVDVDVAVVSIRLSELPADAIVDVYNVELDSDSTGDVRGLSKADDAVENEKVLRPEKVVEDGSDDACVEVDSISGAVAARMYALDPLVVVDS